MAGDIGEVGYLRIANNDDREKVASILFSNGYTVSIVRKKRNGKSYEYFVRYEIRSVEIDEHGS